jgi:hypothetical protein
MSETLEVKKKIEEIEQMYKDMIGEQISFSMFDPKGSIIFHTDPYLKQLIEEKKLIVRPFSAENSQRPTEYQRWEAQWTEDCKTNFLSLFGTYVIDSGTTWLEAMANYISRKKGGKRNYELAGRTLTGNLEIQDYIPMYNMVMDLIKIV